MAVGTRPTGIGFLVSRWDDRLSVCVGIRVYWCQDGWILELGHWGNCAVVILSDACSGTKVWRRCLALFDKLAFDLSVHGLNLRLNDS